MKFGLPKFAQRNRWRMEPAVARELQADARLSAAVIGYVGPGGCGKTRAATDNALTCAYLYGLTVFVNDPNREFPKALERIREFYKDTPRVREFLDDKRRIVLVNGIEGFEKSLEKIRSENGSGVREPQAVWLFDEALLERVERTDALVPLAMKARNHGVTVHLCGQRMLFHPSVHEVMRGVVAWSGGEDPPETLLGVDVDGKLARPRSDELTFVVAQTGELKTYNHKTTRHKILVAPTFPSIEKPRGFLARVVDS